MGLYRVPWSVSKTYRGKPTRKAQSFSSGEGAFKTSEPAKAAAEAGVACSVGEAREWFLSPSIKHERSGIATAPGAAEENAGDQIIVGEFGFNPLNWLLHGSTTTMTPNSDVVGHINQALQPVSRRGARGQGREGDAPPPKPAMCLSSDPRGDRSGQGYDLRSTLLKTHSNPLYSKPYTKFERVSP